MAVNSLCVCVCVCVDQCLVVSRQSALRHRCLFTAASDYHLPICQHHHRYNHRSVTARQL